MSWQLTELESSLYLSWLLARAHQVATPGLKLKWNPRHQQGGHGLVYAAQKMLKYIDDNLFPVNQIYNEDADAIWEALTNIPIYVLGHDAFDETEHFTEYNPDSTWYMALVLVHIYEYSQSDFWAYMGYAELRNKWGIDKPAPPWALANWLEEHGNEVEPKIEYLLGLVYFLRFVTNSTGHQFLDYTHMQLGESYTRIEWTKEWIIDLTEQWQQAKPYRDIIRAFTEWSNDKDHPERLRQVADVLAQAGRAVMAAQTDKDRWDLSQLELAYARLEGRTDDVDAAEVARAMGDWETVLDLDGDGSEEWDDDEEE